MSERQFDIWDDPFRKAAEQYEPEFTDAAWEKMEAKLDADKRRPKPFYWMRWLSDAVMMGIILLMASQMMKHNSTPNKNQPASKPATQTTSAASATTQTGIAAKAHASAGTTAVATDNQTGVNAIVKETKADGSTLQVASNAVKSKTGKKEIVQSISVENTIAETANNEGKKATVKGTKSISVSALSETISGKTFVEQSGEAITTKSETKQESFNPKPTMEAEKTEVVVVNPEGETSSTITNDLQAKNESDLTIKTTDKTGPAALASENAIREKSQAQKAASSILKPSAIAFRGFYLHGSFLPEYSFIGAKNLGPLTAAWGGGVGYTTGKRWSVQAGIYSTNKIYVAGPGDYTPKKRYNDTIKLQKVDAKCKVTEIPLMVNYALLNNKKQHLVVSAGLATLIMSSEHYDYHYKTPSGRYYYYEHTYTTKKVEWLAAAMLAAGYSYDVSGRLSLLALPYVKVPLHGIGEGSVKLSSAGMMLGVQYGILDTHRSKSGAAKKH